MYQILVLLTAGPQGLDALRAYERKALKIAESYEGRLVTAFVPEANEILEMPDEIHLIEFPSKSAFLEYRNDKRVVRLSEERLIAISDSVMYSSAEFVRYSSTAP